MSYCSHLFLDFQVTIVHRCLQMQCFCQFHSKAFSGFSCCDLVYSYQNFPYLLIFHWIGVLNMETRIAARRLPQCSCIYNIIGLVATLHITTMDELLQVVTISLCLLFVVQENSDLDATRVSYHYSLITYMLLFGFGKSKVCSLFFFFRRILVLYLMSIW